MPRCVLMLPLPLPLLLLWEFHDPSGLQRVAPR
jgi:hypothetical protein